jgi:signal transduction histidine kinase
MKGNKLTFESLISQQDTQIINDDRRITQIIINLLSNANKFTYDGAISLILHPFNASHLMIEVKDNGIGIKEEDKSKLFQIFGRLRTSEHLNTEGVGLGLTIVKSIVTALEGDVWFESLEAIGTSFFFTIKTGISDIRVDINELDNNMSCSR